MGWSTKSVFGIVKIPVIEATAGLFDHLSQERLAKNFCPGAPILKFPTYRNPSLQEYETLIKFSPEEVRRCSEPTVGASWLYTPTL